MTRLTPIQICMFNLAEISTPLNKKIYKPKEKAYEEIKRRTGQDFGYNIDAWKAWLSENMKAEWEWADEHLRI
jgi:hypothetical protein